jgi:hypothetical protein
VYGQRHDGAGTGVVTLAGHGPRGAFDVLDGRASRRHQADVPGNEQGPPLRWPLLRMSESPAAHTHSFSALALLRRRLADSKGMFDSGHCQLRLPFAGPTDDFSPLSTTA